MLKQRENRDIAGHDAQHSLKPRLRAGSFGKHSLGAGIHHDQAFVHLRVGREQVHDVVDNRPKVGSPFRPAGNERRTSPCAYCRSSSTVSEQPAGLLAALRIYKRNIELVDDVFNEASIDARRVGGRKVAVLCLNDVLFDQYLQASRISGKFVPLTTREDLKALQYSRGRCIFSMPEYVAGLQFDTVYLLHVDQADLNDEMLSQGARRRYVNRVYLGASRAQTKLVISASLERGGASEVLEGPRRLGSLEETEIG